MTDIPSITCPVCGKTSYHANDIEYGYCASCHAYTTDRAYADKPHIPSQTPKDPHAL